MRETFIDMEVFFNTVLKEKRAVIEVLLNGTNVEEIEQAIKECDEVEARFLITASNVQERQAYEAFILDAIAGVLADARKRANKRVAWLKDQGV